MRYIEALNVTGESMEPLIKDSSIVFIDRSKNILTSNEKNIYVVNTPHGVLVKWLSYIPNYDKVELTSQNKLFTPELFSKDDVTILGRVVGVSNSCCTKEVA
jgi:phage repressor protein C with HTH and peptisase S24 domain